VILPARYAEIVSSEIIVCPFAGTVIALPLATDTVPPYPVGEIVVAVEPVIVTTTGEPVVFTRSSI
jgi:hypothetical protein